MPLIKGSDPHIIAENVAEMRRAGHPEAQAVAAAMRIADEHRKAKRAKAYPDPRKDVLGSALAKSKEGMKLTPEEQKALDDDAAANMRMKQKQKQVADNDTQEPDNDADDGRQLG